MYQPLVFVHRTSAADGVRCGNHKSHGTTDHVYHADTEAVRSCYLGDGVCSAEVLTGEVTEDGERVVTSCAHALHVTERGHHCDGGHDYVDLQTRHDEGWDYADNEEEAVYLRKHGVDARVA